MIPDEPLQRKIKRENLIKLLIVGSLILGGIVVILAVPGMLVAFLLAFVISYLLKPLVTKLEKKGLSRTMAVLVPFVISGAILSTGSGLAVNRVTQQASLLKEDFPRYVTVLSNLVKTRTKRINTFLAPFTKVDLGEKSVTWMQNSASGLFEKIPEWISTFLSTMVLAPFFAFFMLRDGQRISRALLSLFPNNLFEVALNLFYQINQQLGKFIRARLFEAIIVGFIVWLGFYSINFPYATLLGLFAGLTNLIPYVGPIIGAVPGILVALVNNSGDFGSVAIVSLVYVAAQLVDMLFVIPLVVARVVDLHPVTVVIVIIIGSQVKGILGMIISVPVASILKLTFTEFYNHVVDFRN